MTPVGRILDVYARHMPGENFWSDVMAYLEVGVVVSTPTHFLMARPIERADPRPWDHRATYANPDTWLVWAAAGESVKTFCLTQMPYPLAYAAWARRDGALKFFRLRCGSTG
jgi:hypothetical protein